MAAFIQGKYRDTPVYIYEDFEAIGALPIYLKRTIPVIDSKSNDLFFGRHIHPGHPNLVTADKVASSGESALIVVMNDRQGDFINSPLAGKSDRLVTIGRAKLFRFAAGTCCDRL